MAPSRLLLRLALRNVRRSARRSVLTALAMVVGLALMIISKTLGDGAHEQMIDQGVRMQGGHIALQAPGYLSSQSLDDMLDSQTVALARQVLEARPLADRIVGFTEHMSVQGLASAAGSSVPVAIKGVDPSRERDFSLIDDNLVEGRYLEPDDRLSAYIGQGLADRLDIHLGSRFVLTAQGADGEIQGQLVRVAGMFRTGVTDLDEGVIHIPLATARSWLLAPGAATTVAVLLENSLVVNEVQRQLRRLLADRPELTSLTWRQISPELDSAVRIDDGGNYLFFGIMMVIVALAVLNAVLMSVLQRRREFGVLRALGLTQRQTGAVVLLEGIVLAGLSGGVGVVLGLGIVWGFWRDGLDLSFMMSEGLSFGGTMFDPVMIPQFRVGTLVFSVAFILAVGILASWYPAYQAAKTDVASAMKFER